MTLHVYEVKHSVLQSHPPHFKCSVVSCGQVPRCGQSRCLKSPVITENSSGHSSPDHWGLQREHLPQGGFACVVLIHRYLRVLSFFHLFTKAKDLRILCLLSYQLVAQFGLAQPSGRLNRITPWGPWCEMRWQMGWKSSSAETYAHWAVCVMSLLAYN